MKDWPPVSLLLTDSADCFQKPLRKEHISVFRNTSQDILQLQGPCQDIKANNSGAERDERPLRWQCPCFHWQSDLFIASQCRSPNLWGFWKAWPGEFLSFHTMCCQIFDVKLEQHCHFPPMTDSLNCKAEMMSKWYQDWSQAVTAAEWDNYRELMNSKHKRVFEDF